MNKFTPGPWSSRPSAGDHQGLVSSDVTGATVAVTYDKADGPLVAAAPDLARALEAAKVALDKAQEELDRMEAATGAKCDSAVYVLCRDAEQDAAALVNAVGEG